MAAIGKIRSWGPFLVGIIGLALFGFIATDFTRSCETSSNQARQQVGEVMGEKLSIQDYQSTIEEFKNVFKQLNQDVDEDQVREFAWTNYVQNQIIEQEAAKLGLGVTDEEMKAILASGSHPILQQGNLPLLPDFYNQQTGTFDFSYVTQVYSYLQQYPDQYAEFDRYWKTVEKMMRQQLLMQKYFTLLQSCMLSNEASAKVAFDGANTESSVRLAVVEFATINDNDVKIEDKDLKAKYDQKKEMFRWNTETRDIKYALCSVVPSATDMESLRNGLLDAAEQLRNDSVSVADVIGSHRSSISYLEGMPYNANGLRRLSTTLKTAIDSLSDGGVSDLITFSQQQGTKRIEYMAVARLNRRYQGVDSIGYKFVRVPGVSIEDATSRADSLVAVIKGGQPIDSVAVSLGQSTAQVWYSADNYQAAETTGPDMKLLYDTMHQAVVGTPQVFALGGQVNVLLVTERRQATLYDVAIVSNEIRPSNDTYENVFNEFSQYVSECSTPADLDTNAEKYGYQVLDQKNLENTATRIGGNQPVDGTREAVKWAFTEAKEGSIAPKIYRNDADGRYVAVAVTKIHPVGYLDQQSVEDYLREEVLKDKKTDMIMKQLAGVTTLEAAEEHGALLDTDTIKHVTFPTTFSYNHQSERGLSGAVAATAEGQMSKSPVRGTTGVFIFQVVDRKVKEDAAFDRRTQENRLMRNALMALTPSQYNPYTTIFDVLAEKARVKDNRYQF